MSVAIPPGPARQEPRKKFMCEFLKKELKTFENHRDELVERAEGKFALVQDDKIAGVFDTYEDALKIGYERFGVEKRFMVKQVSAVEQVHFFARDISPCHS